MSSYACAPGKVVHRQCDSLTLSPDDILAVVDKQRFKLFSVDGGHTVEHTVNDLKLAERVVASKGVVILDDYYNPMWPGVHEGFIRFMSLMNCRLAPIAFHANKLFLTLITHHEDYLACYREQMDMLGYKSKVVKMCGFAAAAVTKK